jgi:ABC-2 type transport system permease protein
MFTIIWNTIKDKKIALLVYCLAAIAFVWMFVALFPSIQEESEQFTQLFESYPEGFFKVFGIEDLGFSTIEKFLALENYSIMWPIMAMFFMVSLAGYSLVREVEKGTAEILLSRPISRSKLYFSRYFAGIIMLIIFTIISVFCVVPLAHLHDVDYNIDNYVSIAILSFLFGWAVFSVAYLFSAIFSEKGRAYAVTGGLLILMYFFNLIASFKEDWENIRYASFFYYYDFNKALIDVQIDWQSIFVFIAAALVCTFVGAVWFHKRDIAV